MLTEPEYGWTDFSLDGESAYRLSYVTDVAMEWLDAAIFSLTYDNPVIVKGFCEPGWMMCAVEWDVCRVFFEDAIDPPDVFRLEPEAVCPVGRLAFCRALLEDIGGRVNEWVDWELYDEEGEEADRQRAARESVLRARLAELKRLIEAEETREEEE